ncbi:hypothetical protein PM082_006430 [Marasmius tenuissimus]|nr:hypothetical protein PM082_006430 [Marasmius tenuissimus]
MMTEKYRRARERLINLKATSGDDKSDFPPLQDTDLSRPGAEGKDATLGDSSTEVGWVWSNEVFSQESLRTEAQQKKIAEELQRVPWFRAKADAQRWIEEVEILEEEFRRMIAGCNKMGEVWQRAAEGTEGRGSGHIAYAHQKSDMFRRMSDKAREVFQSEGVGGGWPEKGESLMAYLRSCRPKMTVDWEVLSGRSLESALQETPGICHNDGSSSDSEIGSGEE